MTSEHIKEVLEFMDRESVRNETREEIIKDWQELGFLDSDGNYTAPYRHLGMWLDECARRTEEE